MTTEQMLQLKGIYLAPWIQLATALIGKTREGGGNMFRHQLDTMAILLDYGYIDSVLLKAAVVHDVLEDIPGFNHNMFLDIDYESHAVYELVLEVTRAPDEPKTSYLESILKAGSRNAKILKTADRISNMISLGFVMDGAFVRRYTEETVNYVFPIAREVNPDMLAELETLVASRRRCLENLESITPGNAVMPIPASPPA